MRLHVPTANKVEVDMIPLIDIISLLLMFLIIVGDSAASASSIPMKLPRADQAKKGSDVRSDGRIVIQLKKNQDGRYSARVSKKDFELVSGGANQSLLEYLEQQVNWARKLKYAEVDAAGRVSSPVKLRIPQETPMREVERVVMTVARVGLVNVQYAAEAVMEGGSHATTKNTL